MSAQDCNCTTAEVFRSERLAETRLPVHLVNGASDNNNRIVCEPTRQQPDIRDPGERFRLFVDSYVPALRRGIVFSHILRD